jgi:hypothetical protein
MSTSTSIKGSCLFLSSLFSYFSYRRPVRERGLSLASRGTAGASRREGERGREAAEANGEEFELSLSLFTRRGKK